MTIQSKDWRIIDLINWGKDAFSHLQIENARNEIEWFLCHVLKCERIDLYINFNKKLNKAHLNQLRSMVKRRLQREPLQHIIGIADFYGRDYYVDKNVLIPRPETQIIIDRIKLVNNRGSVLDIGTGSGCIAITVALEGLSNEIYATDINQDALSVAKKNAEKHQVKNITFYNHDFLHSMLNMKFDIVVSNPPYIPENEFNNLDPEVKNFEPISALTDNLDGLTFYRKFSDQCKNILKPNGVLILEFGGDNKKRCIEEIFKTNNLKTSFFKDFQSNWRIVEIRNE